MRKRAGTACVHHSKERHSLTRHGVDRWGSARAERPTERASVDYGGFRDAFVGRVMKYSAPMDRLGARESGSFEMALVKALRSECTNSRISARLHTKKKRRIPLRHS